MKDSRTQTIINALMHNWISLYGVPETITSDRGSQFLSQEWKDLLKFLGIRHIHTTAYHPQSNGLAWRTLQTIKKSLRAMLNDTNWYNYLPLLLLALRSQTKEDLDASSSEIVFGTNLRLPGEFFESGTISSKDSSSKFLDSQRKFLSQFKYRESRFPSTRRSFVDPNLNKCRHVFIRNDATHSSLLPTYDGPFLVLHKNSKYFIVLRNAKEYTVSIDRLKAGNLVMDFHKHENEPVTNMPSISGNTPLIPKPESRERSPQTKRLTRFTRTRQVKTPKRFQDCELE